MLAATLELFNFQQSNPGNEFQNQVQSIRGKADAIHTSAEKVITNENGFSTTELLLNIENRNQQSVNLPFSLIALHIQARVLEPSCFLAYFGAVRKFIDHLPSDIACNYLYEVEEIFRGLAEIAILAERPKVVVNTLRKIITLACPNVHLFSPMYAYFLQVCIKGQFYGLAVKFIQEHEIHQISERTNAHGEEFLKYFYYSGICYISQKDYRAAMESLITCITTPCATMSQIILHAIKKAKLISLLETGEKLFLPKYTSATVLRSFYEDMQPYDFIVERYLGDNINELANLIHTSEAALIADNNYGLAKRLISNWKLNKIRNISKSFITLSLTELLESMNMEGDSMDLEKAVFNMISEEKIVASIHPTEGVISFEEPTLNQREFMKKKTLVGNKYEEALEQILHISHLLREEQKEVLTSKEYLQKELATKHSSGVGGTSGLWGVSSTMEFE